LYLHLRRNLQKSHAAPDDVAHDGERK